uniref:Uncharacterized protein n=1 Tax=Panagrellus redivivus TaxID=6233 RepID=A0A7E4VWR8_PANRE
MRIGCVPLTWEPIDLRLSHHCPVTKVALRVPRQFGATHAYLHGACEIPGCREEFHLYEIAFETPSFHVGTSSEDEVAVDVPSVTVTPPKRTSTFLNVMNSAKEVFTKHKSNASGTGSPTSGSRATKLRQRVRRRSASSSAVSTTDTASNRD